MITNPYYIRARLFPTLLTSIPLLIFVNQILSPLYTESLKSIYEVLPTITNLGLSAAVIFLSVQINRLISKEVFQNIFFQDELKMPTTEHLLWKNNNLDVLIKSRIHSKIKDKTGIELLSEIEEQNNENRARKLNVTAVSQIRNALRENSLLLQHNIEYGFFRNLIGGCCLATLFAIAILVFSFLKQTESLKVTGIILLIIYLVPILLSKFFIRKYGNYYSKILFEQYLSI